VKQYCTRCNNYIEDHRREKPKDRGKTSHQKDGELNKDLKLGTDNESEDVNDMERVGEYQRG
jgi:hypothetical protein